MLLIEILRTAIDQLLANRMRSVLTTLGIVIGIGTVILIVSVLEGFRGSIERDLNVLGANTFQVQQYGPQVFSTGGRRLKPRKKLTLDLVKAIRERCPSVKFVGAEVYEGGVRIAYEGEETNPNVFVFGATPEFAVNNGRFIADGRFLTERDVRIRARVVVLGMDVVDRLFTYEDPIGKTVRIKGQKFKVVGIFEKQGSSTFGQSRDNIAAIPITTWQLLWGKRSIAITVMARSPELFQQAQEEVIGVLRKERKVPPGEENDFDIFSNESLVESFNQTAGKIQLGGILLGIISLLVGGIGVMNIMLVSVTERTREIGIRRAVGARRAHIFRQFLTEAIVLCLMGGILGIIGGIVLAGIIALLLQWPMAIPAWSVVAAVLTTTVVGLISGFYPAYKAAYLNVIDALRYE
ncbi:MAG: FtsX-like permease family protein [Calditrichaeota bacterium]|nr:FtsX-like permease family protein [Calditrichota bacterium]